MSVAPRAALASRAPVLPEAARPLATVAAVVSSLLLGVVLARSLPLGVAGIMAALYTPIVLVSLPAALALWAGVIAIEFLPVTSVGPKLAGLMVLAAWVAVMSSRRMAGERPFRIARVPIALVALLVVWLTITFLWARDAGQVGTRVWEWYVALAVFAVCATAPRLRSDVRLLVLGFVGGAFVSVVVGFADTGLHTSATALESSAGVEGRLVGGSGDPNYLAAGLVPAIALAGGAMIVFRNTLLRLGLVVAAAVCALGLFATQSRGGLVAAAAALVCALFVARGHRMQVVGIVAMLVAVGLWWAAANPAAVERILETDDGGTGRSELWRVAWNVWEDNPVIGVGLNNYVEVSHEYARQAGSLEFGELIAERRILVHNGYLQMLAEAGVIGLLLFLAVIAAAVRAAWLAARRFDRLGDRAFAGLARTVIIAQVGALAAAFFLSYAQDKRLWILLALGPALLAIAHGRARQGGVA